MVNTLKYIILKNYFIMQLFSNNNLDGYKIISWKLFSLKYLGLPCHCIVDSIFIPEKSTVILVFFNSCDLYILSVFFQIIFLLLMLHNFTPVWVGVDLYQFILLGIFISFVNFVRLFIIFSVVGNPSFCHLNIYF